LADTGHALLCLKIGRFCSSSWPDAWLSPRQTYGMMVVCQSLTRLSSQTREDAMSATVLPQPALKARRQNLDGDTIVELRGTLDSSLTAEFREEALSVIKPGCHLVLDLAGLTDVSPTGVRMLLMFFRRVRAGGGTISFTGASPKVLEVAEAAGYLELFR